MVRIFSAQNEEPHSPKIEWTQLFIAWNSVKSLQLTFYDNDIKDNMKSSGMQRKPPQNSTFVLEQRAELSISRGGNWYKNFIHLFNLII